MYRDKYKQETVALIHCHFKETFGLQLLIKELQKVKTSHFIILNGELKKIKNLEVYSIKLYK